jgi:hypothetical protein
MRRTAHHVLVGCGRSGAHDHPQVYHLRPESKERKGGNRTGVHSFRLPLALFENECYHVYHTERK